MTIEGLEHLAAGKVRDLYAVGDERLLLVASDRVSTYDVVHPTPVPDKGRVLTGLSAFWFARLSVLGPHHLLATSTAALPTDLREHLGPSQLDELRGRMMLCRRVDIVPFECVVRGYLAGSGWTEYQRTGAVCGVALPAGLREASALPEPIFTPATKAEHGDHDENVSYSVMADRVGTELADQLRSRALAAYAAGASHAADRGIILADTKFEFGLSDGEVVLADEVLTPDSSRYWPQERWAPGGPQPSYDKQYVRDFATSTGWDKQPPAPVLPAEVVGATRQRYVEAYERLTGEPFSAWLERN